MDSILTWEQSRHVHAEYRDAKLLRGNRETWAGWNVEGSAQWKLVIASASFSPLFLGEEPEPDNLLRKCLDPPTGGSESRLSMGRKRVEH